MQGSSDQGSSDQGSSIGAERLEVKVEDAEGSARLDRVLAARVPKLSRSRLKALILAGHVSDRATAPVRDPAHHVSSGDTIIIDVPEATDPRPPRRKYPARYRLRGRRHHRHRQAGRPRRASGRGTRHGNVGQCADRPLRREPLGHRRREAAGHRAPARQGHDRAAGRRQERQRTSPRCPRSSPTTAAPARCGAAISPLSGACRTACAARSMRRSTAIPMRARRWRCARAAARRSPIMK